MGGPQGVVEGDDGAGAGIPLYLAQHLTAIELGVVVARHEIPHDDAVALAQCTVLVEAHEAVGRTEEVGRKVAVGLVGVGHVVLGALLDAAQVVVGVIAYVVPALDDHPVLVGVLAYIVAYHEEGGFNLVLVQHIEYPRGDLGYGAVVEGEVYGPLRCIHPPACTGVQSADELWGLLNEQKKYFLGEL